MKDLSAYLKEKAMNAPAAILLPEGQDARVREAACKAAEAGICRPVLLLNADERRACGISPGEVNILDPDDAGLKLQCARRWAQIKGISEGTALPLMDRRLNLAAVLLRAGIADAMVAGACNATADVLRPALELRKLRPGSPPVTSCFIMQAGDVSYGSDGTLIFADCGMNPEPSAAMLAQIAGAAAKAAGEICGMEPKVAMLSFSTKGSAAHPAAGKMRQAAETARLKFPGIVIDGELQADAALVPWIGEKKAPDSEVAGKANVLIFPDLNSGNIAYKLVERLAGAKAIGPVILGLEPVVNDLSRGCSVNDIVDMCAVTSVQTRAIAERRPAGN